MLSGIVCPREAKSLPICEPVSYEKLGESVATVIIFFLEKKEERCLCFKTYVRCLWQLVDFFFSSFIYNQIAPRVC